MDECKPLDAGRNDAYDAAITAAVTRLKKAGRRTVDVIDAGAGGVQCIEPYTPPSQFSRVLKWRSTRLAFETLRN